MKRKSALAVLLTSVVALAPRGAGTAPDIADVVVEIQPRSGSTFEGTATFSEACEFGDSEEIGRLRGGVRVVLDIKRASPGKHGVHIHEKDDCSAPDAMSAGDHFSPDERPHGLPPSKSRHLGDLGNVEVGASGTGHLDIIAFDANLHPDDPHSFMRRAIVVHADEDNGSQPSGNAGARIGCGEIRR